MSKTVHIKLFTHDNCDKCHTPLRGGDTAILTSSRHLLCTTCAGSHHRMTVREVISFDKNLEANMMLQNHPYLDAYCDSLDEKNPMNTPIIKLWKRHRGF